MPVVVPTCARRKPVLRGDSSSSCHGHEEGSESSQERREILAAPCLSKHSSTKSSTGSLFGTIVQPQSSLDHAVSHDTPHQPLLEQDIDGSARPPTAFGLMQRRWQAERRDRQLRQHAERAAQDAETAVYAAEMQHDSRGIPNRRRRRRVFDDDEDHLDDGDPSGGSELDVASVCACCIIITAVAAWFIFAIGFIFGTVLYMNNQTVAESWAALQQTRAKNLGVDVNQLSNPLGL